MTLATFQSLGDIPSINDVLNIVGKGLTRDAGNLSRPGALVNDKDDNS